MRVRAIKACYHQGLRIPGTASEEFELVDVKTKDGVIPAKNFFDQEFMVELEKPKRRRGRPKKHVS